ncbi:hypothetical protein AJ80_02785 [Polytolypa hystricis UAMH7299]|uniref:Uncharacterized protein n=1 Tax=Polytolypa hystricis (strain UAMH7299) TaxID=1447883 RepID=A0A2B7YQ93_POLH7|nr:hypothetical protein AJ80_02785 [Polytolypa hystricis UAMH7299]
MPIFFQPMQPTEFKMGWDIPEFDVHGLIAPNSAGEYCHSVSRRLGNCLCEATQKHTNSLLFPPTGWYSENETGPCEYVKTPEHHYDWFTIDIYGIRGVPHLVALSMHMCHEDSHILRSELMILTLMTRWNLRKKEWLFHVMVPVLLVSIRAHELRVIEAYYDDDKKELVVRYSAPFPIRPTDSQKIQQQNIDEVIRWICSKPVGDTTNFEFLKGK